MSAVEVCRRRARIPAVGVFRVGVSLEGKCSVDPLVLAEDALAGDTLVLAVDLTVRAEGMLAVAAGPLVLTMDTHLLSVDTQVLADVWVHG